MKKSFRFVALFIAALMAITGFVTVALAEPGDTPVTNESVAEPSADAPVSAPAAEESEQSAETPEITEAPEVSEPLTSEPAVSEPESSVPESSVPESSVPESSAPESSVPESSAPESSVPESSAPESSVPESSVPESSAPESSEPEVSQPEQTTFSITFTLEGNGTVGIYKTSDSSLITELKNNGTGSASHTVTVDYAIKFTVNTTGTVDVAWTEPHRAVAGNYYYLVPSRDSSVTVKIKGGNGPVTSEPESSVPESSTPESSVPEDSQTEGDYTIRVNVNSGGKVTAGDRTINGGTGTNLLVKTGETLKFTVTPEDGYEVASFRIDGENKELTDNTYTLENITADASISVAFRTKGSSDSALEISVTDIDWSQSDITVDVSGGKVVLREVFDKIATLAPDETKYVSFVSENGTISIPYGGVSVGTAATVDMSVQLLADGEDYAKILALYGDDATAFKAYSINVSGNALPAGTKVSFELGAEYSSSPMYLITFDGEKLSAKGDAIVVSADGKSGMYNYANETLLVCASGVPGQFTIESILVNVGGNINPLGISDVEAGSNNSYVITATEGYTIKQILVDDVAVANVEGMTTYIHIFEEVGENHTIKVEFAANENALNENNDDGGNGNVVIVVLIIVLVAVLGAAALFIVKWRQEKY